MTKPASMQDALARVDDATNALFQADPRVRAVGIEALPGGRYGLVATRCRDVPVPLGAGGTLPARAAGLRVRSREVARSPAVLARLPMPLVSAGAGAKSPEQCLMRPLRCGAELQNFDADHRAGVLTQGHSYVGTLGCFVRLAGGGLGVLSNNHVLADENHGVVGIDRVFQCAALVDVPGHRVALLERFERVQPWAGAAPLPPATQRNLVDAAVARVDDHVTWLQAYPSPRAVSGPLHVGEAELGDRVYKVGRTTGLTTGTVTQVSINVGPLRYRDGDSHFRRAIVITGDGPDPFALPGDSGSAIVRTDGALVGLLFAGNDYETYACDAVHALAALGCTLA